MDLIYPCKIKDTTEPGSSAWYLDCYLCIDNGKLVTKLYDKRDFKFLIVDFHFLCSNILLVPAYGVYVGQVVASVKACCKYQDFVDRGKLLTSKLLSQSYR